MRKRRRRRAAYRERGESPRISLPTWCFLPITSRSMLDEARSTNKGHPSRRRCPIDLNRHCEERSDEANQGPRDGGPGLLLCARNDVVTLLVTRRELRAASEPPREARG